MLTIKAGVCSPLRQECVHHQGKSVLVIKARVCSSLRQECARHQGKSVLIIKARVCSPLRQECASKPFLGAPNPFLGALTFHRILLGRFHEILIYFRNPRNINPHLKPSRLAPLLCDLTTCRPLSYSPTSQPTQSIRMGSSSSTTGTCCRCGVGLDFISTQYYCTVLYCTEIRG